MAALDTENGAIIYTPAGIMPLNFSLDNYKTLFYLLLVYLFDLLRTVSQQGFESNFQSFWCPAVYRTGPYDSLAHPEEFAEIKISVTYIVKMC